MIFLFNAKGANSYTSRQGARNLMRCARAHEREEAVKASRVTKVLRSLADRFSVTAIPPPTSRATSLNTSNSAVLNQLCITNTITSSNTVDARRLSRPSSPPLFQEAAPANHTNSMYTHHDSGSIGLLETPGTEIMQIQQQQQQQYQQHCQEGPQHPQEHVTEMPAGVETMQCDVNNIVSQFPLWDIPTGIAWSDLDALLQTDMTTDSDRQGCK